MCGDAFWLAEDCWLDVLAVCLFRNRVQRLPAGFSCNARLMLILLLVELAFGVDSAANAERVMKPCVP